MSANAPFVVFQQATAHRPPASQGAFDDCLGALDFLESVLVQSAACLASDHSTEAIFLYVLL